MGDMGLQLFNHLFQRGYFSEVSGVRRVLHLPGVGVEAEKVGRVQALCFGDGKQVVRRQWRMAILAAVLVFAAFACVLAPVGLVSVAVLSEGDESAEQFVLFHGCICLAQ